MSPLRAYEPIVSLAREHQIQWDWQINGVLSVRVVPGAGANVTTTPEHPEWPAGPVPDGLLVPMRVLAPAGLVGVWPFWNIELDVFDGHCQRADIEANRLRQSYLPAVLPPGAPGFTGFNLRDLRSIAKAFSEPSIYAIQD